MKACSKSKGMRLSSQEVKSHEMIMIMINECLNRIKPSVQIVLLSKGSCKRTKN